MFAIIAAVLSALLLMSNLAFAIPISYFFCRDQDHFHCYTVRHHDTWQKLFKDPKTRDLVMRVNRMNTSLERGMKIAIPKNLDDPNIMDFSPFPLQINPPGEKVIMVSINPRVLAWGAYDSDGQLKGWGPASGGQDYCPDLHRACHSSTGKFSIYRKEGRDCVSSKFPLGRGGAPMPYCMYFNNGFALHGSYEVPGHNASHGCIRMLVPDAEWLNHNFVDDENVTVIISYQAPQE